MGLSSRVQLRLPLHVTTDHSDFDHDSDYDDDEDRVCSCQNWGEQLLTTEDSHYSDFNDNEFDAKATIMVPNFITKYFEILT